MENSHNLTMDSPVRSVALDPFYHKPRSGRRFVVGWYICLFCSRYLIEFYFMCNKGNNEKKDYEKIYGGVNSESFENCTFLNTIVLRISS